MSKESKTISNEMHELEYVAEKFKVPVSEVMRAKEQTGSNVREVVYKQIQENKEK